MGTYVHIWQLTMAHHFGGGGLAFAGANTVSSIKHSHHVPRQIKHPALLLLLVSYCWRKIRPAQRCGKQPSTAAAMKGKKNEKTQTHQTPIFLQPIIRLGARRVLWVASVYRAAADAAPLIHDESFAVYLFLILPPLNVLLQSRFRTSSRRLFLVLFESGGWLER